MPKANAALLTFNRGLVGKLGLARTDLDRTRLSAETQDNWMPRVLGSMMLRPGLAYKAALSSSTKNKMIPFVFAQDDTALIQVQEDSVKILVDESPLSRPSVSTTIGDSDMDGTGSWTDADETGATSALSGHMSLRGTGYATAIRRQQVTVAAGDQNVEHALRIDVVWGGVTLKVGSSSGADDYIAETKLDAGLHDLAFTPTGNFWVEFSNREDTYVAVDSCEINQGVDVSFTAPYQESDLPLLRWTQSGDVVYIACEGHEQRKVVRRGERSWSFVRYEPNDGPFRLINTSGISLSPTGTTGFITLTASDDVFHSGHERALFRIESVGQQVSATITGDAQFTGHVRVSGVGSARDLRAIRTGTWTATATIQRSIGEPGNWTDVTSATGNTNSIYNDGLDNTVIYYRMGIKSGDYTSGTMEAELRYESGSIAGVARITAVNSATDADAIVLSPLGGTDATEFWSEGVWSDYRGWPSAVSLHEGRLWWAGKDKIWGSISDAYESFDDEQEGDAGPISRSIGTGPVDNINWLLPLQRLLIGTAGAESSARSTSFEEPLTPTNFNIKALSTQGSAKVNAEKIDGRGVFVQRSGRRIYQLVFDGQSFDYQSDDLTAIVPEIGDPGVSALAVQRQPDTRVHCVRDDGTVAALVFDPTENVMCWVTVSTDGEVEDVVVLPGDEEDKVYYVVKRTINGTDQRYLERWAKESECRGGTVSKCMDSHIVYSGPSTTTITGLDHLEGEEVVVWGDGADQGTYTVSSGSITLDTAVSDAVVGLGYDAQFKSSKMAYAAAMGTALTQIKRIDHLGLVLADTHKNGIQYGPNFTDMDSLPNVEEGKVTDSDKVWDSYDNESFEFDGPWDTDARICLKASAPRPATVLALVASMVTNDKA